MSINLAGRPRPSESEEIVVRPAQEADVRAIRAISTRDCLPTPSGAILVAAVDGRVLAACSVGTGDTVADPFAFTADLVALLQARAAQLRAGEERSDGRRRLRPALGRA